MDQTKELLKPIRNLECCCCGESTRGRQWWNRDTGYGICRDCITFVRSKKKDGKPRQSEDQIRDYYGMEGIHFNVS